MAKDYKTSFLSDAVFAGVLTGLAVLVVFFLSTFLKWQLNDHGMWESLLMVIVLICGAAYFGNKRAALAGGRGQTYGQTLGFLVISMLFAAAVAAIGTILLQKVIAPAYYAEVLEHNLAKSEEMMETMFAGNTEAMEQGLETGRKMATNAIFVFFATFINTALYGILASLFISAFVKRSADPFFESEKQQPQQPLEQ